MSANLTPDTTFARSVPFLGDFKLFTLSGHYFALMEPGSLAGTYADASGLRWLVKLQGAREDIHTHRLQREKTKSFEF